MEMLNDLYNSSIHYQINCSEIKFKSAYIALYKL
jgi:hypothetical protein